MHLLLVPHTLNLPWYSTGESPWVKDMIDQHDIVAKENGSIVRIPHD